MTTKATKKTEENLPATVAEGSVPAELMGLGSGAGMENTTSSDVDIPRILLLQAGSPQVEDGEEPGTFYHTILEENVGTPIIGKNAKGKEMVEGYSLTFVPIAVTSDYVLWNPRHDGGGILDRAPLFDAKKGLYKWNNPGAEYEVHPEKDSERKVVWKTGEFVGKNRDLAKWGTFDPNNTNKQRPAATLTYYILGVLPDRPELGPMLFIFSRSQVKVARSIISTLKLRASSHNLDIYASKFKLTSFNASNEDGDLFKNMKQAPSGFITKDEFPTYRDIYEQYEGFSLSDDALDKAQGDVDDAATTGGSASDDDEEF